MTDPEMPTGNERVARRAGLSDEERAAGSDDPMAEAAAILDESDARTLEGEAPGAAPEHRHSEDTVEPP
jgi:hypothetical protein